MPKVELMIDGPFKYSDGEYHKGDVFEVGPKAAINYVEQGIARLVEEEAAPAPAEGSGEAGDEGAGADAEGSGETPTEG